MNFLYVLYPLQRDLFIYCIYYRIIQTVKDAVFRPLSYCFKETITIGFKLKASFARPPVSHLIKPDDIAKELSVSLFSFTGLFKD